MKRILVWYVTFILLFLVLVSKVAYVIFFAWVTLHTKSLRETLKVFLSLFWVLNIYVSQADMNFKFSWLNIQIIVIALTHIQRFFPLFMKGISSNNNKMYRLCGEMQCRMRAGNSCVNRTSGRWLTSASWIQTCMIKSNDWRLLEYVVIYNFALSEHVMINFITVVTCKPISVNIVCECEWVNVSSGTGTCSPGLSRTNSTEPWNGCVCVCMCVVCDSTAFNVLMLLVGRQEWHPAYKKLRWVCWRGMCLGQDADLYMAQLMPWPLSIPSSSKSRLVLPSWFYLSASGSPG